MAQPLVEKYWSLVLSFDTTTALSASLRGNRAKSRFNYREREQCLVEKPKYWSFVPMTNDKI
ncbi:MAG: hypothetical protein V7K77_27900 [Nostoc sp.]|uniref:hypothetical protein n=1 Tax=Nostoc sp. TaxID=1180 RepID=UPI002FF55D91